MVKRGSITIKIYRTPSHGCDSFTLSYYQDGVRKRPTFSSFATANAEANHVCGRLAASDSDVLTLTSADRAAYLRARQLLDPLGISIEMAAAEFAKAKQKLADLPLETAVDFYLKRHPAKLELKPVKSVIEELLDAKKQDGLSERYVDCLRWGLGKFAAHFCGNINTVAGTDIDAWLRESGLAPRTRNNLRNAVQTLFRFAKSRRYLPKDHDELEAVALVKDREGKIEIFTPAELAEILMYARTALIPFLALGAFAGVRHAEIQRLDWKDIRLEDGIIEIHAAKAKTASRRTVPLVGCLREWLEPYRQASGPVCSHRNMAFELHQLVGAVNRGRREAWAQAKGEARQRALREAGKPEMKSGEHHETNRCWDCRQTSTRRQRPEAARGDGGTSKGKCQCRRQADWRWRQR